MNPRLLCLLSLSLGCVASLSFSFRSQHDGYIMPYWKTKDSYDGQFFEDAVVVTPQTIVLGDGLGGTSGWSGFYSNYQCLKLSKFLLDPLEVDATELLKQINRQTLLNNFELEVLASFEQNAHHRYNSESKKDTQNFYKDTFHFNFDPSSDASYKSAYEKAYRAAYEEAKGKVEGNASDITDRSEKDHTLLGTKKDLKKILVGLSNNHPRFSMATTMVYLKLKNDQLVTGVAGDSSYLIFRYCKEEGQMKLMYISPETVYEFNTPHSISETGISKAKADTHTVKEGDIVLVASDGVLDVLSVPFLTAATNFLVKKMVEFRRKKLADPSLDENIDFNFDLAGFLESYVDNLSQLSLYFKSMTEKNRFKVEEDSYRTELANLNKELKTLKTYSKKSARNILKINSKESNIKKVQQNLENVALELAKLKTIDEFKVITPQDKTEKPEKSFLDTITSFFTMFCGDTDVEELRPLYLSNYVKPTQEKIESIMNLIYQEEICNTFDPTHDSRVFRKIEVEKMKVATTRKGYTKDFSADDLAKLNCFEDTVSVKKTNFDFDVKNTWKCDALEKLNGKTGKKVGEFYEFDSCVANSTPKLPQDVTEKEIAQSFNSCFFARNIGFSAKFMSKDERKKIDEFTRKMLEDPKTKNAYIDYNAKSDDIGIAAASLTSEDTFDQANLFNEIPKEENESSARNSFLKNQFDAHANGLRKMISKYNLELNKPIQSFRVAI